MPRIAIAHQLRASTSIMLLIITLGAASPAQLLAHWQFTYAYSNNLEDDRLTRDDARLYYTRVMIDRATGAPAGPVVTQSLPLDNIRDVDINSTATHIDVQVWGIMNTSVLVLHFTLTQMQLAQRVANEVDRLQFRLCYLPMQKRAKMPVSISSFAASPVI